MVLPLVCNRFHFIHTVGPLISGHQRERFKCPLIGGVRWMEVELNIILNSNKHSVLGNSIFVMAILEESGNRLFTQNTKLCCFVLGDTA